MLQTAKIDRKQMLGEALLEAGAIDGTGLQRALAQERLTTSLRLGEILVVMGLLALHDLVSALQRRAADCLGAPGPTPLGGLMVAQGVLTNEQLNDALARQKSGDTRPLGRILLETQAIGKADLLRGLVAQTRLRHATAMAMLGASLSLFQPAVRAGEPATSSTEVELSLTIAPRMELIVEETLAQLIGDSRVIQMPTMITLPDIDGPVASVLAEPLASKRGELAMRNAAGDVIPFSLRIVSNPGEEGTRLDPGKSTVLSFPSAGNGIHPNLEFDLSLEDLMAAQAGGYHATVVILIGPEV